MKHKSLTQLCAENIHLLDHGKREGRENKRGALNLSKKKMQLMFKGLRFCRGTAFSFFQAAFKDPKLSPIIKGHLKGVLFFSCTVFWVRF